MPVGSRQNKEGGEEVEEEGGGKRRTGEDGHVHSGGAWRGRIQGNWQGHGSSYRPGCSHSRIFFSPSFLFLFVNVQLKCELIRDAKQITADIVECLQSGAVIYF